jgi:hypothetical protein
MRAYTVAATAVTLGVSPKWLDNVLSHHQINGVVQKRQGIVRRITPDGLLSLQIALHLNRTMEIPIKTALKLAHLLKTAEGGEVAVAENEAVSLRVKMDEITRSLNRRLDRALEITPTPRRGRPPRK